MPSHVTTMRKQLPQQKDPSHIFHWPSQNHQPPPLTTELELDMRRSAVVAHTALPDAELAAIRIWLQFNNESMNQSE